MTKQECVKHYMQVPMNKWPVALQNILRNNSAALGFCGEICVSSIEEWYDKSKKND